LCLVALCLFILLLASMGAVDFSAPHHPGGLRSMAPLPGTWLKLSEGCPRSYRGAWTSVHNRGTAYYSRPALLMHAVLCVFTQTFLTTYWISRCAIYAVISAAAFVSLARHPTFVGRNPKCLMLLGYLSTCIASLLGMWTVASNGAAFPAVLYYILTGVSGAALWVWTGAWREAAAVVPADIVEALPAAVVPADIMEALPGASQRGAAAAAPADEEAPAPEQQPAEEAPAEGEQPAEDGPAAEGPQTASREAAAQPDRRNTPQTLP